MLEDEGLGELHRALTMWHWDQGRLAYFQFDALTAISRFVLNHDFKASTKAQLAAATGLSFQAPPTHGPWRNYSRALKLAFLISERKGIAEPTPIAKLLATPGAVTSDEYLHFLLEASSEPSPALAGWSATSNLRHPLLFAVKYLLAKIACGQNEATPIDELIGAYRVSKFAGSEDEQAFIALVGQRAQFEAMGQSSPENLRRQARESIRVICQISYLFLSSSGVSVALDTEDARNIFADLKPIGGTREQDGDAEIRRIAQFFSGGTTHEFFQFPNTVLSNVVESGFSEGSKVEKTHVTIERNSGLRAAYFSANPTTVCDLCAMDTHASYPWADRIMDLHHLLPLASGTRVKNSGTTFDDLVPVCPSCHRAVHRFYGSYFKEKGQKDFTSRDEAVGVYENVKGTFGGIIGA